jgi:hypothetical protein
MSEATFAVIALLVLGWAVVSEWLTRANLTRPRVFALAGFLLANSDWGPAVSRCRGSLYSSAHGTDSGAPPAL